MSPHSRSRVSVPLFSVFLFAAAPALVAPFAVAQTQATQATAQTDAASAKPSHLPPAQVAGNWQVSWQGRLGTEQVQLHLQQDGAKLTGTFQDLRGSSTLSGTIDEKTISFDVQFAGPRPFTTRFTGTAESDKIEGTSQAVGVGAFLGHPGEIVHPDHPWTAKRVADQPAQTGANGSSPNAPAQN